MRQSIVRSSRLAVLVVMAIVSSYGALKAVANPYPSLRSSVGTSGAFYDGYRRTYGQIYRSQPAVRTVVDFFARNIAQLGLQAFERRADNDRVRLFSSPIERVFRYPNPATSRYRFIESTVQDIGVYANGFWLKVRPSNGQFGLVRVPAAQVKVAGGLLPFEYIWEPSGSAPQTFAPTEIVHFRMYDPENPNLGFPPLETLRRVLAEEAAAADYRQYFWKNAARVETVITRPATAPKWTPEQKSDFRGQWQEFAGAKAGKTPVLEDGMELKEIGFNARDSQYMEGRKLSREEVAASYHVPLPMVGILDHATFSNVKEQHKQLYQDCLGPWLTMLQEDIELQLLPEFEDPERVYVEFNFAAKLAGAFEEQADSLSKATGRPYMTANEARARLNMPRDPDPESDTIAKVSPGQATSTSTATRDSSGAVGSRVALASALERFAARQMARLEKVLADERAESFQRTRWCRELTADLVPVCGDEAATIATAITDETHALLAAGSPPWSTGRILALVDRLIPVEAR